LLVLTLNLLVGYGGQISIGHAGLLGVGGYSAALLAQHLPSLAFPLEVLLAGLATALVGFLLGLPTGRLRGSYLAVVTIGFGVAVPQIANDMTSITGGYTGLVVGPAHINSLTFSSPVSFYYVALIVVALCFLLIIAMLRSSTGRAFQAVRDSEAGAAAMGVNVARAKVLLFTVSAFYAGVAGDLFAHYQGIVSPDSFPFSLSLLLLAVVMVGGAASVWGSIIGAAVLVLVQNATSSLPGESTTIVGGVVVALLVLSPGGLVSIPGAIRRRRAGNRDEASAQGPAAVAASPSPVTVAGAEEVE
ncbi:MAG TPA: branched-chain amino acid ABC transporter permease, partial [Acidimicrobiales bacterium]|nr:branched-chain amino acid ABC transporter permease [Acidimicrobiales bacterium]